MQSGYSFVQKLLHWIIALCVVILIPVGLWMSTRATANLWDSLTHSLYAWHKAIGFLVLWTMFIRLLIKLRQGTPAYPSTLSMHLLIAAKIVHGLLYVLLIAVPIVGWAGVTAYPALITVGDYNLPALPLIPKSEALAKQLFNLHGVLAMTLGVIALGHIAAALKHLMIDRDGVFQRMWHNKT